jgi:hypothetical protein
MGLNILLENLMRFYLIATILLSTISFAEEYPEAKVIKQEQIKSIKFRTVCIDGYKFLNTDRQISKHVLNNSTIQIFEEKNGVSVPSKCK